MTTDYKALLEARSEAIWTKDLERLLSFYSHDIVYFDIVPPLQYVGIEALRGRFTHWLEGFEGPIRQELHDLTVVAGGDVASTSMLIRAGGKRTNGPEVAFYVRATSTFRAEQIVQEHVSLPVDLGTGRAVTDLVP